MSEQREVQQGCRKIWDRSQGLAVRGDCGSDRFIFSCWDRGAELQSGPWAEDHVANA